MAYPLRRRRFGQHFLHDRNAIRRIIEAIGPEPGMAIVEIGPGRGAITVPLLERAGNLHVVEIDGRLAADLSRRCEGLGTLHVHRADALQFNFAALMPGPLTVVGNLPYNISTPLLFHLLEQAEQIREMVFMLQKEVVDRIAAAPGSHAFGRLSVMVQARCDVEKLFDVGPQAFTPPPRVESSVLRIRPRPGFSDAVRDPALFAELVRNAFHQRRKMVRNSLHPCLPGGGADLERAGISPTARAEELSVAQYITLANSLAENGGAP